MCTSERFDQYADVVLVELNSLSSAIDKEIARSLMRGYERKERNISFANLVRIIKLGLGISIEEFFSSGFDTSETKKKKK